MKFISICIVAAALGLTEALYVKNRKCPNVTSVPYNSEMATTTFHRALYIDSMTYSYANQVTKLTPVSRSFNMTCANGGTWGNTPALYEEWYQNETSPLAMNVLYYDGPTQTRFYYNCLD